jgi:hypothetical protein
MINDIPDCNQSLVKLQALGDVVTRTSNLKRKKRILVRWAKLQLALSRKGNAEGIQFLGGGFRTLCDFARTHEILSMVIGTYACHVLHEVNTAGIGCGGIIGNGNSELFFNINRILT